MENSDKGIGQKRITRRELLIGLSATAASLAAAGCGVSTPSAPTTAPAAPAAPAAKPTSAPAAQAAPASAELRFGRVLMPRGPSLDPMATTYGDPEFTNLYDALTDIGRDGNSKPALATEWKNLDPLTWEFKLRQGVKFHNGDPFTADDVQYSLQRIQDPANKATRAPSLNMLKEIQVVAPDTVRVITAQPYSPLPSQMASLKIVPSKLVKQMGNEAFAAKPVGTGPFKFVEWVKADHISHVANSDYWGGAPGVGKITYYSAPEASTRVAKLLNNEVDLIETVLDADIPRIKADSKLKILEPETNYNNYLSINSFQKPWDDKRVRQAMNYAVDMDTIIAKVLGGHGIRVNSTIAHTNFGYDKSIKPFPYDPAKAKQLLAEAGYGSGNFPPQVIDVGQGRQPYNQDVSEAIAGYFTAAGMPTKVNVMESAASFEKYTSGKAGLMYFAQYTEGEDADANLGLNFHSKQRGLYYHTPQLDAMIDAAKAEFDLQKRKQMYSDITKLLMDEGAVVFLYDLIDVYGSKANLEWDGPMSSRIMPMQSARFK